MARGTPLVSCFQFLQRTLSFVRPRRRLPPSRGASPVQGETGCKGKGFARNRQTFFYSTLVFSFRPAPPRRAASLPESGCKGKDFPRPRKQQGEFFSKKIMPRNMFQGANGCDTEPYGRDFFTGRGGFFPLLRKFCPVTREIWLRYKGILTPVQGNFRSGIRELRDKKGGSFTTIGTGIFPQWKKTSNIPKQKNRFFLTPMKRKRGHACLFAATHPLVFQSSKSVTYFTAFSTLPSLKRKK